VTAGDQQQIGLRSVGQPVVRVDAEATAGEDRRSRSAILEQAASSFARNASSRSVAVTSRSGFVTGTIHLSAWHSEWNRPVALAPRACCAIEESYPQSRKATLRMALDWPSVFITTRCQPWRVIVAWSGCRMRPLTYTPALRRMARQAQAFAFGLPPGCSYTAPP
jgi:hypothetical protein